jgi:hypothetical protein
VHGQRAAVVVSAADYDAMIKPRLSFAEFLLADAPWPDDVVDAINDRSPDTGRDVDF